MKKPTHRKNQSTQFWLHMFRNLTIGLIFIIVALFTGMLGYHWFEHMSWIDAFLNASMILSGMGPAASLVTFGGKLFAGVYALFSGLAFIAVIALVFAPIIHRFFRKIHLESNAESAK
ncbi:MAG: hypothetical protein ABI597_11580 [Gammaproteobacteria bacterium]